MTILHELTVVLQTPRSALDDWKSVSRDPVATELLRMFHPMLETLNTKLSVLGDCN
ncbi:hypothetical protein CHS0354_011210, partial [Potamilus streckersoni]